MSPTMRPLSLLLALAVLGCMPPQDPPFLTAESTPITSASPECVGGEISYVTSGDGSLTLAASAWDPPPPSRLVITAASVDRGPDLTIDAETCAVVTSLTTAEAVARVLPYMLDAPLEQAVPTVCDQWPAWQRDRDGGFTFGPQARIGATGTCVLSPGTCLSDPATCAFWRELGRAWAELPLWARTRQEWRYR